MDDERRMWVPGSGLASPRGTLSRQPDASVDTTMFLAHAVAFARDHGYVPAAATHERPTWRAALERLACSEDLAPADIRRAHEILGWASSLEPRDADSYRARMAACLARERLTTPELALAASAVRAFDVHLHYEVRRRRGKSRRLPR